MRIRSHRRRIALYILVCVAVSTWWWSRSVEGPDEERVERLLREPDYYLTDFVLTEMDESGQPAHTLVADNLYHYPGNETATLAQPRFALYENNNKVWDVSAAEGLVSERDRMIHLTGEVVVRHLGDDGGPDLAIHTDELYVWPDEERAETQRPVRIEHDSGVTKAIGMRADLALKRLRLLDQVRGRYEP